MSKYHVGIVGTARWQWTRRAVFQRDSHRCRSCGRAGRLECDHIVPLDRGGDAWDLDNLQSLCRGCHIAKTGRERPVRPVPEAVQAWRRLVDELT